MFKKKTKKFTSAALVLVFIASLMTTSVYAMDFDEQVTVCSVVQPRWSNVASGVLTLDLTGTIIEVAATYVGYKGTTFTNGTVVLEKISGSNCGVIETWHNLSSNSVLFQFEDTSVEKTPGTYRMTLTIDAVRNGVTETITVSKESSC